MRWTEGNDTLLREWWAEGRTAEDIRKQFGGDFTRNMIIGRAFRLRLDGRPKPEPKAPMKGGSNMLNAMTPEKVAEFKAVWASGLSVTQMGPQFGMRRSSVSRVARLLGLPRRELRKAMAQWHADKGTYRGGVHSKHLRPGKSTPKPTPRPRPREVPAPDALMIPLMELGLRSCRWPHGDPGSPGFGFCGQNNWNGLSYCEHHAALAYVPVTSRSERDAKRQAERLAA